MILGMLRDFDVRMRLPRPRASACWLLLLAYVGVIAHEMAPEHADVEATCTVCNLWGQSKN